MKIKTKRAVDDKNEHYHNLTGNFIQTLVDIFGYPAIQFGTNKIILILTA